MITVSRTTEYFDRKCGLQHLQIEVFLHPAFNYENYFERPRFDNNWPPDFVPYQICNCRINEDLKI